MLRALTSSLVFLTTGFTGFAQTNEFRGMWVNAWNTGLQNASQVTTLVNNLRAGKFNAVIPQVRRRGDALYTSHFEPHATGTSPADFDSLGDLIAKAHDTNAGQYIEVHAWLVTYHIKQGISMPSQPSHPLNLHPDWLLLDVNGTNFVGNEYTFDPGHPEVQKHTFNVAMDIVTNYNVDGINFDYIRYSDTSQGYNPVTVARFNHRFGRTGQPAPGDALWKQFRRDQVTGLLRKVYLNVMAVKPWVKVSADTITWAPGPVNDAQWYSSSAAWNSVLQDWRGWMEEGILDLNVPMNYFRETTHPTDYVNWMNFAKDHQFNRHAVIGPGTYLNSESDAIVQLRKVRDLSPGGNYAAGVCGYDYNTPYLGGGGQFATFQSYLTSSPNAHDPVSPALFAQSATIPVMPWKATPTKGHLKGSIWSGNVTNGLDGAIVTLAGPVNRVQTNDATGFYGFVDLPPGNYTVQAVFPGYASVSSNVTVSVGAVATRDLQLVYLGPPSIVASPQNQTVYAGAAVEFSVTASGPPPLAYQWRQNGTNVNGQTSPVITFNPAMPTNAGSYTVVITNVFGAVTSQPAVLTVIVPPPNTRLLPLWNLPVGSRAYITTGSTERGLAINPLSDRLLLVGRFGSPQVYALNPDTGADQHTLSLGSGIISGGTYTMQLVGAADDGAVYVCNLTLNGSTTAFRLYRWANDNPGTTPTVAFSGDPHPGNPQRWGDTMDVRGAGANTQIIIGSRSGTNAVVFTTANGTTFTPNPVNVSGVSGGAFGLGLAFGTGNTFWGKATGQALRRIGFNLGTGVGTVQQTFGSPGVASSISAIGVQTNLAVVVGVAIETPDNVKLYDLSTNDTISLAETNGFATDNDNSNLTGAVDFDGDRVFALDTNNGILAMRLLPPAPGNIQLIEQVAGGAMHLIWSGHPGFAYTLETSSNLVNWAELADVMATNGVFHFFDTATNLPQRFYRARN